MKSDFNKSYVGPRPDILGLVPLGAKSVLDVGCSTGMLGEAIKKITEARVVGIDISKEMATVASRRIDKVIVGDIENKAIQNKLGNVKFDVIILADILEHLRDPWDLLKTLNHCLAPKGVVIASIPNVRHLDTVFNLTAKGRWPYRKRGIHDETHLRFFTRKNIFEMFENANLEIEKVEVHYRLIEGPHFLNQYAKYFALPVIREFLAFQYLIVAHKK